MAAELQEDERRRCKSSAQALRLQHPAALEIQERQGPPIYERFSRTQKPAGTSKYLSGQSRFLQLNQWIQVPDHVRASVAALYARGLRGDYQGTGVFIPPMEFQANPKKKVKSEAGTKITKQRKAENRLAVESRAAEFGLPEEWPYLALNYPTPFPLFILWFVLE